MGVGMGSASCRHAGPKRRTLACLVVVLCGCAAASGGLQTPTGARRLEYSLAAGATLLCRHFANLNYAPAGPQVVVLGQNDHFWFGTLHAGSRSIRALPQLSRAATRVADRQIVGDFELSSDGKTLLLRAARQRLSRRWFLWAVATSGKSVWLTDREYGSWGRVARNLYWLPDASGAVTADIGRERIILYTIRRGRGARASVRRTMLALPVGWSGTPSEDRGAMVGVDRSGRAIFALAPRGDARPIGHRLRLYAARWRQHEGLHPIGQVPIEPGWMVRRLEFSQASGLLAIVTVPNPHGGPRRGATGDLAVVRVLARVPGGTAPPALVGELRSRVRASLDDPDRVAQDLADDVRWDGPGRRVLFVLNDALYASSLHVR